MKKIDLKRDFKHLYLPSSKQIEAVKVPSMNFLMIDGLGDPNTSPAYADAVEALFAVSYAIKFMIKRGPQAIDYGVMPLEGLWWADDMSDFITGVRSGWQWTMMIMQPQMVTREIVDVALASSCKKKELAAISNIRFEVFDEGLAAQVMHIGPFSEEGPVIKHVHNFIEHSGRKCTGKHHEIYLSDIRKAEPAKWKTVIRQPMN